MRPKPIVTTLSMNTKATETRLLITLSGWSWYLALATCSGDGGTGGGDGGTGGGDGGTGGNASAGGHFRCW